MKQQRREHIFEHAATSAVIGSAEVNNEARSEPYAYVSTAEAYSSASLREFIIVFIYLIILNSWLF